MSQPVQPTLLFLTLLRLPPCALAETATLASGVLAPQRWPWFLLQDTPLDSASADFRARAQVESFIGANMLKYQCLKLKSADRCHCRKGEKC